MTDFTSAPVSTATDAPATVAATRGRNNLDFKNRLPKNLNDLDGIQPRFQPSNAAIAAHGKGLLQLLRRLLVQEETGGSVELVFVDQGYAGEKAERQRRSMVSGCRL